MSEEQPTILVVDDEPHLLALLVRVFERRGFRVFSAPDGTRALEIFLAKKDQIEVMLLDVVIPPEGVGPVLDRMREVRSNLAVVLTSGDHLPAENRVQLDQWGGKFLLKPFTLAQAVETVRGLQQARVR